MRRAPFFRSAFACIALLLAAPSFAADKAKDDKAKAGEAKPENGGNGGPVQLAGMSIVGNDEAPKELVIVPWKSSQLGDAPGISRLLDDSTQPVDKDVFQRELEYYQIRSDAAAAR